MTTDVLDEEYLDWLYAIVGLREENVYHYSMLRQLLSYEFVMLVPNDDNRCVDGIGLRKQFVDNSAIRNPDPAWMSMGCSVLEMMIVMARHLSFQAEGPVSEWFWHLCDNLGLTRYNDGRWHGRRINEILERLVWRQYSYDGNGGLFPLKTPYQDQRKVELWFQMESYILEME